MSDDRWCEYLAAFHAERPGVTEAVLGDASAEDGDDPYDWLAEALPGGLIVDVACGSGPLAVRAASGWIGLDRSFAELDRAAEIAPGGVVLADAASTPLRTEGADAVVCSMALMLFDDPGLVVAELARLLPIGGLFVALVPAAGPLTIGDWFRYGQLLAALRLRRLPFRHLHMLEDVRSWLDPAGLTLVSAEQRRFAYVLRAPDDGLLWLRSLYLPELSPRRWHAARRVTERWTGSSIGLPLRRVVASRSR